MFSIQLLESAKEELSFRTVVRDVQTNQPMLQLVLLNPDSWCYTGCCLCTSETAARTHMYPTVKILFSACSKDKEVDSRSALTGFSLFFVYIFNHTAESRVWEYLGTADPWSNIQESVMILVRLASILGVQCI